MTDNILIYQGYQGSVEFDLENNCLHGKVLHVTELITYEAETIAGLRKEFESAVDDYLELCKEIGKNPEKSFKGSFNIRVGADTHKTIAYEAEKLGIALNEFVCNAIQEKIEKVYLTDQNWATKVSAWSVVKFGSPEEKGYYNQPDNEGELDWQPREKNLVTVQ